VLKRSYQGPLGAATGAERLHIRIADLLAHGWYLAQITGQFAALPADLSEQALTFTRAQLSTMPRTNRFDPCNQSTTMLPPSTGSPLSSAARSTQADDT
ncbi:MAG TPA: hypothetical protein VE645_15540, partial [Pseudonocardiaceae bacterium]|nr:hypothetical protein [Pseudonocardiaceae bacterium]